MMDKCGKHEGGSLGKGGNPLKDPRGAIRERDSFMGHRFPRSPPLGRRMSGCFRITLPKRRKTGYVMAVLFDRTRKKSLVHPLLTFALSVNIEKTFMTNE